MLLTRSLDQYAYTHTPDPCGLLKKSILTLTPIFDRIGKYHSNEVTKQLTQIFVETLEQQKFKLQTGFYCHFATWTDKEFVQKVAHTMLKINQCETQSDLGSAVSKKKRIRKKN